MILEKPVNWIARTKKDWIDIIVDLDASFLKSKERFENYQKQK